MTPLLALVTLALGPWTGAPPPAHSSVVGIFALTVRSAPRTSVLLRAQNVPPGWVASFCSGTVCSPSRYLAKLDGSGRARIEFQIVREEPQAAKHARIGISAPGARGLALNVISP